MNDTEFVVILGHFLSLDPPNNLKNQILKKWKKCPEILSFYICVPQMTIMWYMVPDIWSTTDWIFCHLDYSLPFYHPNTENQNFEKMKKLPEDIIILHMCTINEKSYDVSFLRYEHERKKHLEISSFWSWHAADVILLFHFGLLFTLLLPWKAQKNQNSKKKEKKRKKKRKKFLKYHFTHVYLKLRSDDAQFLRCGARQKDRWADRQTDRQKKWHTEVGAPPKNLCEGHHFFGCTPTFLSIPCLSSMLTICRKKIASRKWWECWQTTSQKYFLIYSMNFAIASKRKTTKQKNSTLTNSCFLILDYLESWFNLMIISVVYFRQ